MIITNAHREEDRKSFRAALARAGANSKEEDTTDVESANEGDAKFVEKGES